MNRRNSDQWYLWHCGCHVCCWDSWLFRGLSWHVTVVKVNTWGHSQQRNLSSGSMREVMTTGMLTVMQWNKPKRRVPPVATIRTSVYGYGIWKTYVLFLQRGKCQWQWGLKYWVHGTHNDASLGFVGVTVEIISHSFISVRGWVCRQILKFMKVIGQATLAIHVVPLLCWNTFSL